MKPAVTCAVVALASVALSSQAPSPTFEVASVKRSTSDGSSGGVRPGPDGITARGASLFLLIRVAYNLQDHQIQGPGWLRDDRYDIVAKASAPVSGQEPLRLMLQALLAERFKLVVRQEQQPRPVYALTAPDGGRKLRKVEDTGRGGASAGDGQLAFTATTMRGLASRLGQILQQPVVDATQLEGAYDFVLTWQPGDGQDASLLTAVREQLGLILESRRMPVDTLVVDRAERNPIEN